MGGVAIVLLGFKMFRIHRLTHYIHLINVVLYNLRGSVCNKTFPMFSP